MIQISVIVGLLVADLLVGIAIFVRQMAHERRTRQQSM